MILSGYDISYSDSNSIIIGALHNDDNGDNSGHARVYSLGEGSCNYLGCTDPAACNYDETATLNDASCEFCSCESEEGPNNACGCMTYWACNYNPDSTFDDGSCLYFDECGVCGGNGIAEGDCNCAGNVLDECGVCGGNGVAEGTCDCDGNVLDECGVCGGEGFAEGECDCEGNVLDECGVCNGPGYPYTCWNGDGVCEDENCPPFPEFSPIVNISLGNLTGRRNIKLDLHDVSRRWRVWRYSHLQLFHILHLRIQMADRLTLSGLSVDDDIGSGTLSLALYCRRLRS